MAININTIDTRAVEKKFLLATAVGFPLIVLRIFPPLFFA